MKVLLSTLFSLLVLIGFVIGGFYFIKWYKAEVASSDVSNGTNAGTQLTGVFADAAACKTDDDCILSPITPYCGCYYLVNKHFDPSAVQEAVNQQRNSHVTCGEAQIQCQAPPTQDQIHCVSNVCQAIRPTVDPKFSFSDDPTTLETQIKNHIANANYCADAADCTIADLDAGCPFGCYNLVSKNADLSNIKEALKKYQSMSVDKCTYKCAAPPSTGDIQCKSNKCIDKRFAN